MTNLLIEVAVWLIVVVTLVRVVLGRNAPLSDKTAFGLIVALFATSTIDPSFTACLYKTGFLIVFLVVMGMGSGVFDKPKPKLSGKRRLM